MFKKSTTFFRNLPAAFSLIATPFFSLSNVNSFSYESVYLWHDVDGLTLFRYETAQKKLQNKEITLRQKDQ